MMRTRKALVAAVAVTAALTGTQTAAAADQYSVEATHTSGGNSLTQSATARVLKGDARTVIMELDCLARTLPPAVGTGITQCYFVGTDGTRRDAGDIGAHPGPVAHRSAVYDVPRQHYRVCVQANAIFHTGSGFFQAPLNCSS